MKGNSKGYLILEILIAIVLLGVVIVSILGVIRSSQMRVRKSNFDTEATLKMEEAIEVAHSLIVGSWDAYDYGEYHPVSLYDGGTDTWTWVLDPGEEIGLNAKFKRKIEIGFVCREDGSPGDIRKTVFSPDEGCDGSDIQDELSKVVKSTVSWEEGGGEQKIVGELMILKPLENEEI